MTFIFANLEDQRGVGGRMVITLTWLMVGVVAAARVIAGGSVAPLAISAAVVAGLATVAASVGGGTSTGRSLTGVGLMAQVSLLVAAMAGHPWQIDMHMAYFAALALLVIYCDWFVIAAAAATVAVHHLGLTYLLPAAVFPGSANLGRVLIHAGILSVEAATLIWVIASINAMFAVSAAALERAEQSVRDAADAKRQAEQAQAAELQGRDARARAEALEQQERAGVVAILARSLARLAKGDLSFTLDQPFSSNYEQLRADLDIAIQRLGGALGQVEQAVGGVRAGSGQIASAMASLSQRTERQAASLEETAAALDEITATVGKTAAGARQAADVVGGARENARQSSLVVSEAVAAMSEIEKSSKEIGQIIGVIDEIAFQTNLLALNAGVEAARAGDMGRGFAVVAQEVRALAQRSADAAKEIKALITNSSGQVDVGVALVARTGEALKRIVSQVAEADGLIGAIAASAQEQASGLAEVNTAVNHMDQVLQQNAAMVEETSATTLTLTQDAARLRDLVAEFVLPGSPRAVAAPRKKLALSA